MSLSPKTLLIVDDETSNVESLQRIFQRFQPLPSESESHGGPRELVVLTCKDGKEALELVRKQRIDRINAERFEYCVPAFGAVYGVRHQARVLRCAS